MAPGLPSFALFPLADLRDQLSIDEWVGCLDAWLVLVDSHLSLSATDFRNISTKDESLTAFLVSFARELARNGAEILGKSPSAKKLLTNSFQLTSRHLESPSPPSGLTEWSFLANIGRVYGKKKTSTLLQNLSEPAKTQLDSSLSELKKTLIRDLDSGISGGKLRCIEETLDQLNNLIDASPSIAEFFLAGSDFIDGLITCYKIMNPPLRKVILSTTYLSLVTLAEGQKASALTDHLYYLKTAATTHKAGPLNVNDSLVAELVTSTPLLPHLTAKLTSPSTRTTTIITDLAAFRKPHPSFPKPKRILKPSKGKAPETASDLHIHHATSITQIQDLFPHLGTAYILSLLTHFTTPESVISHLLDNDLPSELSSLDTTANIPLHKPLSPRATPPPPSDLDLDLDISRLHIGKATSTVSLAPQPAPAKAAILSALAAFDSDDDERDDTYDAADVGGTVDAAGGEDDTPLTEGVEAILFKNWSVSPNVFARDAVTRKGIERLKLRDETQMTDEQIEGWGIMIGRDGRMQKRLAARFGEWSGEQTALESTSWRDGQDGEEIQGQGQESYRGGRGRGRGRGGMGRGGAPVSDDVARRRKEANKGSRANHNRRDQRARKMARGGMAG